MARGIVSKMDRRPAFEALYEIDPRTGASIEVFYADRGLAESFGTRCAGGAGGLASPAACQMATGPFASSYLAYRDALAA